MSQLAVVSGSVDDAIARTNFTVRDYTEAMDLLTNLDKTNRIHFERVLRLLLNANPGMFHYIQHLLQNNTFSLSMSLAPRWRNCLSYSSLKLLERMGFIVFTRGMKVSNDTLTAYVSHENSEMCDILITDYCVIPTYEAVALSIYVKNYDLAIKYLNGVIDKVLVWLVHISDTNGIKWLIQISGRDPKLLRFLREHTQNTQMNAVLTSLGVPR